MLSETSRAAQKAATRARILDAARAALEAAGYEKTNLRAVAQAAGVSTGAILAHFRDKQDLLHTALFEDLERTWATARLTKKKRTLEQELTHIAATFFDYYAKRPALSRALLRESLFADPPWSERFAAQVADVHHHVAALHRQSRQSSPQQAALFAAAFFSFYYFALLAWLQGGHPDPLGLFHKLLSQHLKPEK
jgi:AcrR family transcriptional regulator